MDTTKILIVDDDLAMLDLAQHMLRKRGYEVFRLNAKWSWRDVYISQRTYA